MKMKAKEKKKKISKGSIEEEEKYAEAVTCK